MERYQVIERLGEGTYGNVWKAVHRQTNEVVAIKRLKRTYYSWDECLNLCEVKVLSKLDHPNIVKLKQVRLENHHLYLVFEYMEGTLYQIMNDKNQLPSEGKIRNLLYQVLQALAYMHHCGYFHRDLKPENLLVTKGVIKVADFGLAKELSSRWPYTTYMTTRAYRAPELFLQSSCYNSAIDMWSIGAIMAELFTLRPLFLGLTELDQLHTICSVIGAPIRSNWSDGLRLAASMNISFPPWAPTDLSLLIRNASPEAIDLISALCVWDPNKRPTALQALAHPFFQAGICIPPSMALQEGSVQQNTFTPCVPDVRAFPEKQIHEKKNGGDTCISVDHSLLPTSGDWNLFIYGPAESSSCCSLS